MITAVGSASAVIIQGWCKSARQQPAVLPSQAPCRLFGRHTMVAIVAGNGLGLLDTSLNTIGTGILGEGMLGQGSSRIVVNVVNGKPTKERRGGKEGDKK